MFNQKSRQKIFRFLICGLVTAAFNLAIISLIIESLALNTPLLRNLANVVAIEISLIFTFFVYKIWVWSSSSWHLNQVFFREIPLFHLSSMFVITQRSLILFPVIDWLGLHYLLNTLIGIALGSVINYFACDKLVFNKNKIKK
jgi:dolichol-phosphate mannosyltransferase